MNIYGLNKKEEYYALSFLSFKLLNYFMFILLNKFIKNSVC
ncbi:hypothetical protein ANASTE_01785 [Anaerofustis stercorihominis DSM 17244]|uniref:Uncharacterized protein n=1 Tax=Anaerofustis stercorihominis DSM 17244 TaxID=445971 RepID=B1C917_9FIRM|nr:hypothetical protein ANASTE_01785 [Anaerofustis stercorihominis DSM 17244]